VGADGTGLKVIKTAQAGEQLWLVGWMPGHDRVVFGCSRPGSAEFDALTISSGASRVLKRFTKRLPDEFALAPDGRLLAYVADTEATPSSRHIALLDLDALQERPLTSGPANDGFPVWSLDGTRLYFPSDRSGKNSLWVQAFARGAAAGAPVEVRPDIGTFWPLGFGREGGLYYTRYDLRRESYTADIDRASGVVPASRKPIPEGPGGSVFDPRWSADGNQLTYRRGVPGSLARYAPTITIRTMATGQERDVHPLLENFWQARLAPDGRTLVGRGTDAEQDRGVFAVDVETGRATLVAREPNPASLGDSLATGFTLGPFTADGKALLGARGGVGIVKRGWPAGAEIVVAPIDAAGAIVLGIAASPDGEWVAYGVGFPKDPTARSEMRVTSLTSGQTKVVYKGGTLELFAASEANLVPQAWSADGKTLLVTGKTDASQKTQQLWTLDVAGGTPKPAGISAESISVSLHPDGRQIVFSTTTSTTELWVIEGLVAPAPSPGAAKKIP